LGIRNLGFATLSRLKNGTPRILRSRNIWMGMEEKEGKHPGRWSPGPDLAHLAIHKREIRTLRQLRGKPVKGEESHIELQGHITHMSDDRFKKSARAIINFALNTEESFSKATGEVYPRADVLVLERLKGFIPDAERERGINRALVEWNRGQTVERVREMAGDVGLKVFEVSPAGTSQICCHCGALGRRYSIGRNEKTDKPEIRFGWVEKLFACAECGYRANADHNASANLHQRFVRGDEAVARFFEWTNKSKREREEALRFLEEKLRKPLERLHALLGSDEET
jgi:transposase